MGEDFFEDVPCCVPDPALDGWDSEWDRDWQPPHRWAEDDAEELAGAAAAGTVRGAAVAGSSAAAGSPVPAGDPVPAGSAELGAPRWIPARGWTGEGEVFAAGFLHRDRWDDVPAGAGFAAGGFMDDLAAGPLLAALISEATDPTTTSNSTGPADALGSSGRIPPGLTVSNAGAGSYTRLGESELIGVLSAWRRLASWAAAGQAAAIAELSRRRHAQARELGDSHQSEHIGDEIAAALTLTGQTAANLHGEALALARLPQVHASLAEGRIDWPKACVFASELRDVGGYDAAGLAARVLPDAPSLTTAQIRGRLRRLVLAYDPEAASQRKADAARETEVVVWTESSGNAALAGRELPESDVLAADRRLTALARWLSERGATGSISQLRSAAFLTLLRGACIESLLPPGTAQSDGPDAPAAAQPIVTGTVHLTLPLSTWAGLAEAAGEVAGYGPVDAGTCRDLTGLMSQAASTRWQLSLVSPAGQAIATASARAGQPPPPGPGAITWAAALAGKLAPLAAGTCGHSRAEDRYQPSGRLRSLVICRQPECSFPGCRRPAARCDLDHTTPYDQGGLTCECNLAPLCRQHHRAKQAPGWRLTQEQPGVLRWQLPSGRHYQAAAHTYPV
jgi:hypothetical protein